MAFDMSKAAFGKPASNLDKVQKIPLGYIKSNEQNFYSIEGIDELADSIAMVGLLEPVRVVRIPSSPTQPYRYKLISGHRRFRAFMALYNRREEGYLQYAEIPALIMEDLDDLSETFALITANSTARELSYAEKLKQEQLLRETLTAMKEAGKPVPKNLGQYIADQIGTSRNEVSRMHSINEHLIPEAREQVDKGEMTAQQAYELSRKPEQEQRETVGAGKRQRKTDAIGDLAKIHRTLNIMEFAKLRLKYFAPSAYKGLSRNECIKYLTDRFRNSGAWPADKRESYSCSAGKITMEHYRITATFAELWDALAIAALECVSKLDTEEDKHTPAVELWHAPDDPPKQDGSYVCMYRGAGDNGAARRTTVMEYRTGAWRMYGNSVEDVYTVLKWTEVPEC